MVMVKTKIIATAAAVNIIIIIALLKKRKSNGKINKSKREWSRKWLLRRQQGKGVLTMLNKELLSEDPNAYRNFVRMNNDQFEYILNLINDDIKKQDTFFREAISARNR